MIDFERKAESFALQWVKRFFAPERAKWKSFFKFYITSCLDRSPQEAFKHIHASRLLNALPPFYRIIFRTLRELDGDRARDELALQASSDTPLPVSQFSSCNTYRLGQQKYGTVSQIAYYTSMAIMVLCTGLKPGLSCTLPPWTVSS